LGRDILRQHAHGRMVLTLREGVHGGRDTVRCYTGQRREVRQVVARLGWT
jgi:hypothetical protein